MANILHKGGVHIKDSTQIKFLEEQGFIFASFFLLANKLQVIGDQHLQSVGLTTKQWFLIAAVQSFATPPTLSEVSELIGSSRQNVKQLALKLEQKNFLKMVKDNKALRLVLTDHCHKFWKDRDDIDKKFISEIFSCLSEEEANIISSGFKKIISRINEKSKLLGV